MEEQVKALAQLLRDHGTPVGLGHELPADEFECCAEAILESDWLAEHDRQIREETFDEGYEAAYGDLLDRDPHRTKNPLRARRNAVTDYQTCPECIRYLIRRRQVLTAALAKASLRTGETADEIADRYMSGVHARHLAGLSLSTRSAS